MKKKKSWQILKFMHIIHYSMNMRSIDVKTTLHYSAGEWDVCDGCGDWIVYYVFARLFSCDWPRRVTGRSSVWQPRPRASRTWTRSPRHCPSILSENARALLFIYILVLIDINIINANVFVCQFVYPSFAPQRNGATERRDFCTEIVGEVT